MTKNEDPKVVAEVVSEEEIAVDEVSGESLWRWIGDVFAPPGWSCAFAIRSSRII